MNLSKLAALSVITSILLIGCTGEESQSAQEAQEPTNEQVTEDSFVGVITGYSNASKGEPGDKITSVYVNETKVDLDLIWPYSAQCVERDLIKDQAYSSAQDALESLLPIGQKVLVLYSNFEDGKWVGDRSDAFLHLLETDAEAPKKDPPADSVNELLVRTGYWVPLDGFDFDPYSPTAVYAISEYAEFSKRQSQYVPLIIKAGDETRTEKIGGQAICYGFALDYQIDFFYKQVSAFRNDEEKNRLLWIERRKSSGCRDGDGDGICYER